ncbi:MAG: hypothetical protein QM710_14365 [Flavobacterium sp.]
MKNILTLLIASFLISCSTSRTNISSNELYLVTKIEYFDNKPIVYVEKDTISGIITEFDTLNYHRGLDIDVGQQYPLKLIRIERNYRPMPSSYGLEAKDGTEKILWYEKDGLPLILYRAENLNSSLKLKR